ncbi:MAG: DsbA family protein, partial [Myxococcales bacterium]|nr:DsbA family protein [Myxococcales bacterium]
MTLKSRLKGLAIGAFVGAPGQRARDAVAEATRVLRRQPRRLEFFHDPGDPWSYLTAQAVARLVERYPVELAIHVVSTPASDVDAEPKQRARYAVQDAAELAAHWDLAFGGKKESEVGTQRKVGAVLIKERPVDQQLTAIIELGDAMWRNDHKALDLLMGKWGNEAMGAVPPILAANYALLRERGHYQGAMLHYGSEWYWGVDRIGYLEDRLAEEFPRAAPVLTARPAAERPPARLCAGDGPVPLDVWWSFRSPYSYLALDRLADLAARYPVTMTLRPVLPMVTRGLPVPSTKSMYIVKDAKREADRLGIPFGRIADPLGQGVEHCLAISKLAIERGRGFEFLHAAATGIWAEALDVASYVDLRTIVERAGLDWADARAALGDDGWRAWAKQHADDLATIGQWGVPTFRAGDWVGWGQDRLPMLEDRLRRHV